MRVKDALLVEGTSNLAILCYGIVPIRSLDEATQALGRAAHKSRTRVHKLLDDGWPNGITMTETLVAQNSDIATSVCEVLLHMSETAFPFVSVCMYDGAFGHYDDLFAQQTASQTYAFCFASDEPVISLDPALLRSPEWEAVVDQCRMRLRAKIV